MAARVLTLVGHDALVSELAERPSHAKGRVLSRRLLGDGLSADRGDKDFEEPVPEVHGRLLEIWARHGGWTICRLSICMMAASVQAEGHPDGKYAPRWRAWFFWPPHGRVLCRARSRRC